MAIIGLVFIPRYSMVMFHHVPYAQAQSRGAAHTGILAALTGHAQTLDEVDMSEADRLIERRLLPLLSKR